MLAFENLRESLPENWEIAKLDDVCEILDRQRIPVNIKDRQSRISGKDKSLLFPYYGATGQVGWIDDYIFDGEYILLGEDGAPFLEVFKNKAYIVNGKFWVNNHAHILKSYSSNRYLCHYLNQLDYRYFVTGTTRLKLNQAAMKQIPIKVSPLPEQNEIVSKIEELFSELDNGVKSLKKAREQLKTYRQAVLKHAFEGKLTQEWREQQIQAGNPAEPAEKLLERIKKEREAHYQKQVEEWKKACEQAEKVGSKKPAKPRKPKDLPPLTEKELAELPELPEGWGWVKLGDILFSITAGKSFKCKEVPPKNDEIGVAKVSAVTWGEYNELESKTCEDHSRIHNEYLIKEGDFLFSRANTIELVGASVIVKRTTLNVMLSDKTLRFTFKIADKLFILYYLRSKLGRREIERLATGNQDSMRNIGQDRIKQIILPFISVEEQQAIVSEIETRLSVCDKLEQTIEDSLKKAEALRQSILKKAFEGELTREWRLAHPELISGENSAENLLARIREEKESLRKNSPQRLKGRRGKTKK
jgi:type I restriction enzyme, S subunit